MPYKPEYYREWAESNREKRRKYQQEYYQKVLKKRRQQLKEGEQLGTPSKHVDTI